MNPVLQAALIAGISTLAAVTNLRISGPPTRDVPCRQEELKPHEICLVTVKERWQGKVLWIDARPRREWEIDGLPGSLLWNLDPHEDANAFEAAVMEKLVDAPPAVVVYCSEGNCGVSSQIAERILKLGVTDQVFALKGGVGALRADGMIKGSN
ncbi:MAG: rhodanese-like domain-containing protein [Luteolibacter sp.]